MIGPSVMGAISADIALIASPLPPISRAECDIRQIVLQTMVPLQWGRALSRREGLTYFAELFALSERFPERMPVMSDSGNTAMILSRKCADEA